MKQSDNSTDQQTSKTYNPRQLKKMLKSIKDDSHSAHDKTDAIKVNGTKFRSYEQLKKELASIEADFKTDLEIIRELMAELKSDIANTRKAVILQDLEYYLHQVIVVPCQPVADRSVAS